MHIEMETKRLCIKSNGPLNIFDLISNPQEPLAIMLGTLIVLLAIVTVIFALVIFPTSVSTSERAARQYTQLLAATQPNLETANNIHKEIGLDIRYEGPDGSWATLTSYHPSSRFAGGRRTPLSDTSTTL